MYSSNAVKFLYVGFFFFIICVTDFFSFHHLLFLFSRSSLISLSVLKSSNLIISIWCYFIISMCFSSALGFLYMIDTFSSVLLSASYTLLSTGLTPTFNSFSSSISSFVKAFSIDFLKGSFNNFCLLAFSCFFFLMASFCQ